MLDKKKSEKKANRGRKEIRNNEHTDI